MDALNALRPVEGFKPSEDGCVVHMREISVFRRAVKGGRPEEELWAYGNRRYVNDHGDVAYRSVGIQVCNFPFYAYLDITGLDSEEYRSCFKRLSEALEKRTHDRRAIVSWDVVMRREFVGFNYPQFVKTGKLECPMIMFKLNRPSYMGLLRAIIADGLLDYRNKLHRLSLHNDDWDWGTMFLHSKRLPKQGWVKWTGLKAAKVRSSSCNEEYTFDFASAQADSYAAEGVPVLCATLRMRIASHQSKASGKPTAPRLDPEDAEHDAAVAVCSDVYWTGHQTPVVRVRLFCGDSELPEDVNDGSPGVLLRRRCESPQELASWWIKLMNRFDVDAFVVMNDVSNDLLQLAWRDVNLSKHASFNETPRAGKFPGQFFHSIPGRTQVDLSAYMKKLQVKPRFDGFNLMVALQHPVMYLGPPRPQALKHQPNGAAFMTPTQACMEAGLEAEIIRICEQGPSIITDAAAISRVCTVPLTTTISGGQQVRVEHRFRSDAHRKGWVINKEKLRIPVAVFDSKVYNSFPEPPKLPNISLKNRTASYDEHWEAAVRANPPHPNMRFVKIDDPPPVRELTNKRPVEEEVVQETQKKVQRDVFGRPITADPKKSKIAKPKKPKYGGGYVQVPQAQFYEGPRERIFTLDFASLYPSIFQAEGYCYSNILWDREAVNDKRLTLKFVEIFEGDSIAFVTHIDGAPIETLVPESERDLVAERTRVKKLMEASEKRCEAVVDELKLPHKIKLSEVNKLIELKDERVVLLKELAREMVSAVNYDKQQLGSKVTQNAMFGFTGVEEGGRMPLLVLMAAITATGRWMIKTVTWYIIRYHKGAAVYGDTDSVMVQVPHIDLGPNASVTEWNKAYFEFFGGLVKKLSALFPAPQKLSLECMSWPYLMMNIKKNYAYMLWESPAEPKKVKISGLPFVKRDRCDWVREICTTMVSMIINQKIGDVKPFLEAQLNRLSSGQIPAEKLATSISLRDPSEYKGNAENLVQLHLARKVETRTGNYPMPGSRITFVYKRGSEKQAQRGELLENVKEGNLQVDLEHYLDQLSPILDLILMHHLDIVPVAKMVAACRTAINRYYAAKSGRSILNLFKPSSEPQIQPPIEPLQVELDDLEDQLLEFDFAEDDE